MSTDKENSHGHLVKPLGTLRGHEQSGLCEDMSGACDHLFWMAQGLQNFHSRRVTKMMVTGKADFTAVMEKHSIVLGILRMVDGQPAIERIDETVFTGQVKDSDSLAEKAALKAHKGAQVMEHKKEERLFTMTADKFLSNATEGDVPTYRK